MKAQKVRVLAFVCLAALAGAFVLSLMAGSRFHFSLGSGSSSFDFGVGLAETPAATALGAIAVIAFLAALYVGLSGGDSANDPLFAPGAGPVFPSVSGTLSSFTAFLRALSKSEKDSWIGGVCGGLGEHTPLPSWVWRMVFLLLMFGYGFGFGLYIILWICLPAAPKPPEPEPARPAGA
jgi:phage shock protein C